MLRKLALTLLLAAFACSRPSEARAEPNPNPQAAAPARPAGPRAEGQGFVVQVTPPASAQVGAVAKTRIVLKPTSGYKVNKEFPTKLTVTPPAGVGLARPVQTGADSAKLEEDEAIFEVAFTPTVAGDQAFEAGFKFAVCTTETCDPKSEKLAWIVPVK